MAVTAKWYGLPLKNQIAGSTLFDWDTDTIKCALTTSSYVVDQDAHDFFNDITNELPTAGGYTAGGTTLTCSAPAYDGASNTVRLDATDAQWTSATFTCRFAIVYKSTGTAATSPLLGYVDFGGDETVSSGTFTVQWDNTDGVLRIVIS
jgi:hypothetical protein